MRVMGRDAAAHLIVVAVGAKRQAAARVKAVVVVLAKQVAAIAKRSQVVFR